MTAMNPKMGSPQSQGTVSGYTPHATSQLPGMAVAGNQADLSTLPQASDNFRSIGDYASSGNYAGGTDSGEPLDLKQARFNNSPYLRRPFGPQEIQ